MTKIKYTFAFLLGVVLLLNSCYREAQLIDFESDKFGVHVLKINSSFGFTDLTDNFILYTLGADTISNFSPEIQFVNYSSISFNSHELVNNHVNNLGNVWTNHPFEIIAKSEESTDTFQLVFTRIPLIQITTDEIIQDEPKVFARISLQFNQDSESSSANRTMYTYAGIEIRGALSQIYEKKSFGIELWEDKYGDDYSLSLLGMSHAEDWILDAMYIDDLRMRNKLSFELWEKLSTVPSEDNKPEVVPGIQCEFVELFINNRYYGIYSLDEKLDEKKLQFSDDQGELGGVLYKAIRWSDGATRFNSYNSSPPEDSFWDGWEIIYPKDNFAWEPLDKLRQEVVLSDDEDFKTAITSLFDIDNAIDYYLFINLLFAADNAGKNSYLARYTDESRFFYIPWDIEASWGLAWDRTKVDPNGLVSNNLFDRLIETNAGGFNEKLKTQWFDRRNNVFSEAALHQTIDEYYQILKNSGVIERENVRWDEYTIDLDDEYVYTKNWISRRLEYLDEHFE